MTAAMIGTGILFFPVAPMFLFMRGKDTVIAQGTPISTYIDGNTELVRKNFIGVELWSAKPAAPPTAKREESPADPAPATSQNEKP